MQLGRVRLPFSEHQRCAMAGPCAYCSQAGHHLPAPSCQKTRLISFWRGPDEPYLHFSPSTLYPNEGISYMEGEVHVLVDSGAKKNFIDSAIVA